MANLKSGSTKNIKCSFVENSQAELSGDFIGTRFALFRFALVANGW
jgi:hypothetical protein